MTSQTNGHVLALVVAEIERIAGEKLTAVERADIAVAAMRIIQEQNKTAAVAAVATAAIVLETPGLNTPADLPDSVKDKVLG